MMLLLRNGWLRSGLSGQKVRVILALYATDNNKKLLRAEYFQAVNQSGSMYEMHQSAIV